MDKNRANILHIQKYLNGELDAKAMHQLERQAQDDPFLMDALEGYQTAGSNQQPNLDMLTAQLNGRVAKKERRIIPWTALTIAASVVGFMIVVGLLYKGNDEPKPKLTAQANTITAPAADTIITQPIVTEKKSDVAVLQHRKNTGIASGLADRPPVVATEKNTVLLKEIPILSKDVVAAAPNAKRDSTPLDEMVMGALASQRDTFAMPLTVAIKKRPISQPLSGKVAGVNSETKHFANNEYMLNKLNLPPGYLTGVAANTDINMAVPGNAAKRDGKPTETLTDNKDKFAAPAAKATPATDGSYSGFVNTSTASSGVGNTNNASVNGYNNSIINTTDLTLAHPQKGWIMYQLYLSQKGYLPAGDTPGTVELKFTVSATGELSDFKIVKGISPAADKKAVSLVAEGPKWVGNANGNPEEKTLQLEFKLKK